MRALMIDHDKARVGDRPDPKPTEGWARLRVLAALVASTDPSRWTPGLVPGHRFVGEVEHASDPSLIGHRVTADPDVPDPSSALAKRGLAALDPDRSVLGQRELDGCLATHTLVPERNIAKIPDEIETQHALLASALGCVAHLSRIERVDGKTFVTVLGDGLHALLAAQVMSAANASVRLLTANPHRLELCTRWGVKHRHVDQAGRRADQDVVIDTGTEPGSLHAAIRMTRPRGAIVLLGGAQRHEVLDTESLALIAKRELRVLGATSSSNRDGLTAIASGSLNLSGLITGRCTLDELPESLTLLRDPSHIALLVTPSEG